MLDCANVTTYLLLAVHAMSLGAVWIQTLRSVDEVRRILKVPEGRVPVAIVAVGWPAESPKPKPRRDLKDILYLNCYDEHFMK